MNIKVDTGQKAAFAFTNSKIQIVGAQGIQHSGRISLTQKQIVSTPKPVQHAVSKKIIDIDNSHSLILSPGLKQSVIDFGFPDLTFYIGANWSFKDTPFDIDLSFFLTNESGQAKEEDFIFYNNPAAIGGAIKLDISNAFELSSQFNACARIDLKKIPSYVNSISITATIFDENRKFGELSSGSLYFISLDYKEKLNFSFSQYLTNENAIVLCEIYKHKNVWKIKGVAQGFFGGLAALCKNFKIETAT